MPKFIHNHSEMVRYADLRGQVIRIPGLPSISWLVVPGTVHHGKIQLKSLPNGTLHEAEFNTIRRWIDRGEVTISSTVGS